MMVHDKNETIALDYCLRLRYPQQKPRLRHIFSDITLTSGASHGVVVEVCAAFDIHSRMFTDSDCTCEAPTDV